jgi:integrase
MKQYLLPSQRNKSRKNLKEKARSTWHANVYEDGRVKSFSLKTTSRKVAMDWFGKMQAGRFAPKEQEPARVAVREAADKFIAEIESIRGRAPGTVQLYKFAFRLLCRHFAYAEMSSLAPQPCADFVAETFAGYSGNTARHRLAIYRSFWQWAADRYGLAGKNPFKGIAVQKPKSEPRKFWTVDECEKIIAAAEGSEMKCWFALMAFAGLRREEARHLRLENIRDGKISLVGKGGKYAQIPISSRLREHLNKYLTLSQWSMDVSEGPLFPGIGRQARLKEWHVSRACAKAGLDVGEAHFHRFRHSFASNLLRAGRSIKAVQLLMRHENVTLTLNIYGHLLPSDLEKEVEL